jgi:hypothetical protein
MYTFKINSVKCNNSAGEGSKHDRRAIHTVSMEQDEEGKMQNILNKCIQHHQAILR